MANVTYTFRFPGRYVGQTVSVYDQSGTQATTGTVDVNGELAVSLPAGYYAVRTADGKYIHGDPAVGSSAPSIEQTGLSSLSATFAAVGLARWKKKLATDPANAKIVFVGDSTSDEANECKQMYYVLRHVHTTSNLGRLNGMNQANIISRGHGGSTRATYFSTQAWLDTLVADNPDLIVYSLGLNDVRDGSTSQAQLAAGVESDVNWLRGNCPNADILLRIPNSMTTDNVGNSNFVTPATAAAAQQYTDAMRNAYLGLAGKWPNVVIWNSQDEIFGRTARASTATRLMKDQLHPSQGFGYPMIAEAIARVIGHEPVLPLGQLDLRLASQPAYPYVLGDLAERADSTTGAGTATSGQAWSGGTQLLNISNKRFVAGSPIQFGAARETINAGIADGEVGLTLTKVDTASNLGIVFRWVDGNNFGTFWQSGGGYALVTRTGGVSTTQWSVTVPAPADGDRIRVVFKGSVVVCYVNDVALDGGDLGSALNTTGTSVGIQTGSLNTKCTDLWVRRLR